MSIPRSGTEIGAVANKMIRPAFVAALMAVAACLGAGGRQAPYGARVRYRKSATIHFPDFDLTFLGERREASTRYPRGFLYYDFRAASPTESRTVSWTSGTGLIGPAAFEIAGKRYLLELKHSDALGHLESNELAVSPEKNAR